MGQWKIRFGAPRIDLWRGSVGRRFGWAGGLPRRAWRSPNAWALILMVLLVGISVYEWKRGAPQPRAEMVRDVEMESLSGSDGPAALQEEGRAVEPLPAKPEPRAADLPPSARPAREARAPAQAPEARPDALAEPAADGSAQGFSPEEVVPEDAAPVQATGEAAASAAPADRSKAEDTPVVFRPLAWPLRGDRGAGFGWAWSETMGDWRWHAGLDVEAAPGTSVAAAAGGRVVVARQTREWGWEVVVDHGGGLSTRYANCRAVAVAAGDAVRTGQKLAEVGDPGLAEAADKPHLHFEVLANGRPVDPSRYLRN